VSHTSDGRNEIGRYVPLSLTLRAMRGPVRSSTLTSVDQSDDIDECRKVSDGLTR
jgi:hypothetical protein